jgi:hypothetical protein
MKRSGLALSLVFVAACGASANDDERASWSAPQERDVQRIAQADVSPFVVTQSRPGELLVAKLGAEETSCADGVARPACPVASIDLSRVRLDPTAEEATRERISESTAFVLAKLVEDDGARAGRLVVSKVFVRSSAARTLEREPVPMEVPLTLWGERATCGSDRTCRWLISEPLDGSATSSHADIDLSFVRIDPEQAEAHIAREGLVVHGRAVGSTFVVSAVYDALPAPTPAGGLERPERNPAPPLDQIR